MIKMFSSCFTFKKRCLQGKTEPFSFLFYFAHLEGPKTSQTERMGGGWGLDLCRASDRVFQETSDSYWHQNEITFILVCLVHLEIRTGFSNCYPAKAHILIPVCHIWPLGASVETWRMIKY